MSTNKTKSKGGIGETIWTIVSALIIAGVIRTFVLQPFSIPSGSMEPTLLVGDYLFVWKFRYGFSRYSFPFSPPIFSGRTPGSEPHRGDVAVFRPVAFPSTDFIKRVIGLPGDRIQVIEGVVHINGTPVRREPAVDFVGEDPCRPRRGTPPIVRVKQWQETLPNGISYHTLQCSAAQDSFPATSPVYVVPPHSYFMMGDNRDNSDDSRFPNIGFVPLENFIGPAEFIFFSVNGSVWTPWRWPTTVRWSRLFTPIR
jgi:signal peptidase I